jgi:hypothetical protein
MPLGMSAYAATYSFVELNDTLKPLENKLYGYIRRKKNGRFPRGS